MLCVVGGTRDVRAGSLQCACITSVQLLEQGFRFLAIELDARMRRERADVGHAASFRIGQRPHGWPEKRDGERSRNCARGPGAL